jgi:hypothetical protein
VRFHFVVGCLCSLSGVLIRIPAAASKTELVTRDIEMNADNTGV